MIIFYPGEFAKEYDIHSSLKKKYAVTNYGRLISYTDKIKDGTELKGSRIDGYKVLKYRIYLDGGIIQYKHLFFFRIVAETFLNKDSEAQTYVLHLDYVRDNDNIKNLKWATREQMLEHSRISPHVIANHAKLVAFNQNKTKDGAKLTVTKVMRIKKILKDPNRKTRKRLIAKQFGISETHLNRIESGENWGHVQV